MTASEGSGVPLPEAAVLDAVAANGHVAPGASKAVGAVIKGPQALRVAACLQPCPGSLLLGVANQEEESGQLGSHTPGRIRAEVDPAIWLEL